jgi:hypothetical protein
MDTVDFGMVRVDSSKSLTFTLIDPLHNNIMIDKVENSNPYFKLGYTPAAPNDTVNINIVYTPKTEYSIITNSADLDTLNIELLTQGNPMKILLSGRGSIPKIFVGRWNAGTLSVGKTSTNTIPVKNPGTDTLIITDISLPAPPFVMSGKPELPIKINPGDTKIINEQISFIPEAPGVFNDSLVFTSDGLIIDNVFELKGIADAASVSDSLEELVKVYPNPAGDYLVVELAEEIPSVNALLYDSKGSEILNFDINSRSMQLSLKNIPQGVYNLTIILNDKVINRKITIVR